MGFTRVNWEDRYELWKQDFVRRNGGDPDDENKCLAFFAAIDGSKDLQDLANRIDEFDPYYYKLILIYGRSVKYQGVKVNVQFEKGGRLYQIPRERLSILHIPMSMMNKVSWCWYQFKELP